VTLAIAERAGGVRFSVHVKPRASKSRIVGEKEGTLEVAVAAPPVDGEANAELVRVLATALGVHKRNVTIASGEHGRRKIVDVAGIDESTARARLEP
jgi:uncharacterized protein (TIGR00251 family)